MRMVFGDERQVILRPTVGNMDGCTIKRKGLPGYIGVSSYAHCACGNRKDWLYDHSAKYNYKEKVSHEHYL